MKNQILFDGETGRVAFDSNGDRKFAEYDILNVIQENFFGQPKLRKIGKYYFHKVS